MIHSGVEQLQQQLYAISEWLGGHSTKSPIGGMGKSCAGHIE